MICIRAQSLWRISLTVEQEVRARRPETGRRSDFAETFQRAREASAVDLWHCPPNRPPNPETALRQVRRAPPRTRRPIAASEAPFLSAIQALRNAGAWYAAVLFLAHYLACASFYVRAQYSLAGASGKINWTVGRQEEKAFWEARFAGAVATVTPA